MPYESTFYAVSLLPAEEIYVYIPKIKLETNIKKRMINSSYKNLKIREDNIKLFPLDPITMLNGNSSLNSFFYFDLSKYLNDIFKSDYIVIQEGHTFYSYQLFKLSKKLNKKYIVMTENDPMLSVSKLPPYNVISSVVLKNAYKICSATELSDRYLLSKGITSYERCYINAVDINKYKYKEKDFSDFKFLFVGHLNELKGFDLFIKALNMLSQDFDFIAYIVGNGELKYLLKNSKFKYKQFDFLATEDLIKLYENTNLFIMPSRTIKKYGLILWTEVFGLANMEAMATGSATVVSNCGNLPYVIQDKDCIFNQGDSEDLLRKIKCLINDSERMKKDSIINRDFIAKKFDPEVMKNAWKRILS
ncbi:MAG: glycosyltransferase family 4 protein [Thermoplasmata archaeon]